MRVTTALNNVLALPGASVTGVKVTGGGGDRHGPAAAAPDGLLGLRPGLLGACMIAAVRRWRHLDLAGHRCFVQYELRRVRLPRLRGAGGGGPVGAPGCSPHPRVRTAGRVLRQRMAKSQVQALLRVAWETVGQIITRVVADRLDERRLEGLIQIGVDEIAYRRGHRYLTNVADHADAARSSGARPGAAATRSSSSSRSSASAKTASGRSRSTCQSPTPARIRRTLPAGRDRL